VQKIITIRTDLGLLKIWKIDQSFSTFAFFHICCILIHKCICNSHMLCQQTTCMKTTFLSKSRRLHKLYLYDGHKHLFHHNHRRHHRLRHRELTASWTNRRYSELWSSKYTITDVDTDLPYLLTKKFCRRLLQTQTESKYS